MINSTEAFKQYQPLIEGFTWRAVKRHNYLEYDDIKQQAYLIFCEAIERFDESRKVKFITFLFHRLRTLNDYCIFENKKKNGINKLPHVYNNNEGYEENNEMDIIDTSYEQFEIAMERLESALELSKDAQEILNYLIGREWETPGINRIPRLHSVKKYFYYTKNWMPKRTETAWDEIKSWWRSGNHFLQEN